MNYGYMGGGFGFWALLWHVLIILLIVWVLIRIFGGRRMWRRGGMGMNGMWSAHSALELLNERFAKGEIDKAEYEERKKTLLGQ